MYKLRVGLVSALGLFAFGAALAASAGGLDDFKKKLQDAAQKSKQKHQQQPAVALQPTRTCDASSRAKICYMFSGAKNAEDKTAKGNQMACKLMRGQYTESAVCPVPRALGRCTIVGGTPDEYTLFYYSGGRMTKSGAESDCKNAKSSIHRQGAGQWTPMN